MEADINCMNPIHEHVKYCLFFGSMNGDKQFELREMLVWEGFQQNCDSEGQQAYMSISRRGIWLSSSTN
jgi:hypothetical protein